MSSYYNAYEIASQVRRGLNEFSTARVQGTDTTGAYPNEEILRAINDAQKLLFDLLFVRVPHLFLSSASLTASASVLTLPADFFKLRRLENSDKVKINPISVDSRHLNESEGSNYLYYRKGNTLRIDKDSVGSIFTLWYFTRPRRLDFGSASAGGALSITLAAANSRAEADYYNGMVIEDITAGFYSTISDYTAARAATISATAAASDYYGLVSELPEEFHHLIGRRALLQMRSSVVSVLPPSTADLEMFQEDLIESIRSYCGDELDKGDMTPEETFLTLEPMIP